MADPVMLAVVPTVPAAMLKNALYVVSPSYTDSLIWLRPFGRA